MRKKEDDGLYSLLREEQKRRNRLESIRLLYVGATRAINHLHLLAELKVDDKGRVSGPPKDSLLAGIWETFKSQMTFQHSDKPQDAASQAFVRHRLKRQLPSTPTVTWMLGSGAKNIPQPVDASFEQDLGNVVHAACENLAGSDYQTWLSLAKDDKRARLNFLATHLKIYHQRHEVIDAAITQLDGMFTDDMGRFILANHPMQNNEWKLFDARGDLYVIDRFFVDKSGQAYIVDYKTAQPESNEDIERFVVEQCKQYQNQLQNYGQLIQKMGFTPIVGIYFTALNRWQVLL
jgi:ATP-dependent exoDNAse (exonuclease V) beta subunit